MGLELPQLDPSSPIPDLGVVDLNVAKVGGGSDLLIVVASPLASDEYSLSRLLRKVELYLQFTNTHAFVSESGFATPHNTRVVVKLHPDSSPVAAELVHQNVGWALNNGVTLVVETLSEHLPEQ